METVRGLLICSFIYAILIAVIYFSKARIENAENKIYSGLLITDILLLLFEFNCVNMSINNPVYGDALTATFLDTLSVRIYLVSLLVWLFVFMYYIYTISFDEKYKIYSFIHKKRNLFSIISGLIVVTFGTLIGVLPMYFYNGEASGYVYGPVVDILIVIFSICVIFGLVLTITSYKRIKLKKYVPVFTFFLAVASAVVFKTFDPSIQLVGTTLSFTTVLMYFTIENPDIKILKELDENKELIEKNLEANSEMLFNITQNIKEPISNLTDVCNEIKCSENHLNVLKSSVDQLKYITSNILNINDIDAKHIQSIDTKYNFSNLIKSIFLQFKNKVEPGVDYRCNVSSSIPEELYGDEVKIKQILFTILNNSCKYTKKGFIEINVSSITKFDACRLIIDVEDSGRGMSLSKVNDLLSFDDKLSDDEIKKLNSSDLNIKLISKIVKNIGGHILIKSNPGKGTKISIVIEQRIPVKKKETKNFSSFKKILVVSDNKVLSRIIKDKYSSDYVKIRFTSSYKYAIERIGQKEEYELVIMEDEIGSENAFMAFSKIITNKPIIVLLPKEKESIKEEYIKDGFTDYILNSNLKNDLDRIKEKYLQ